MDNIKLKLIKLLTEHADQVGTDIHGAIRDFITDLHHLADEHQVNFDLVLEGAEEVYQEHLDLDQT
jgi:hypothetical protein